MFRAYVLIVRRAKLYYTVSGIITPIGGRPVHRLREEYIITAALRDAFFQVFPKLLLINVNSKFYI